MRRSGESPVPFGADDYVEKVTALTQRIQSTASKTVGADRREQHSRSFSVK